MSAATRSIDNAEIDFCRRRQRLIEGVEGLIRSVPSRVVSLGMLVAAATVGVVLEHSRDLSVPSLMRTIEVIANASGVIARWEQRLRDAQLHRASVDGAVNDRRTPPPM
jgi:hypothetical protein